MHFSVPITSRANARLKALRASFSGQAARPGELIGLEGEHLIAEALRSGLALQAIFIREGSEEILERPALASIGDVEIFVVTQSLFSSTVGTLSPQGIAAVIAIPPEAKQNLLVGGPVLVLESLQDPGNLGTLLRSAEAFGVSGVLLMPECVNRWNPKVVRASAGSVFRMPAVRARIGPIVEQLRESGITLYAAVAPAMGAQSLLETQFAERSAIFIGNEGAGLSQQAIGMCDVRVTIPCAVESLNAAVAGSTILFEAMRQRKAVTR